MVIEEEDYLEHHGVKGMKWGVRKQRTSSGRSRGSGSSKKRTAMKVGAAVAGTLAVSAAAVALSRNPKAVSTISKTVSRVGNTKVKDINQNDIQNLQDSFERLQRYVYTGR